MDCDRYSSMEVLIGDLIRLTAKTQVKLNKNEKKLKMLQDQITLLEKHVATIMEAEKTIPLKTHCK